MTVKLNDPLKLNKGFTIVELLVVIVVIGLLTTITIVAYNGIQDKAKYASMQLDLKSINTALALYKVDNLSYPSVFGMGVVTGCHDNWCGWDQSLGNNFIPGLVPKYLAKTPQLPVANAENDTYLYWSNGTDYQLIRFKGTGLSLTETTNNLLLATTDGYNGLAWGYRTDTSVWH